MRAQNQQDLIYKRGQAGITKASVTIVFDNSDRSTSPVGLENCKQITVTRQVRYMLPHREAYTDSTNIDRSTECIEIPSQWAQISTTYYTNPLSKRATQHQ